jgi:hypothetical protein
MERRAKVELFEQIRREYEFGTGTIRLTGLGQFSGRPGRPGQAGKEHSSIVRTRMMMIMSHDHAGGKEADCSVVPDKPGF